MLGISTASPRENRRRTMTAVIDDDMPPTTSLRDLSSGESPMKPQSMSSQLIQ